MRRGVWWAAMLCVCLSLWPSPDRIAVGAVESTSPYWFRDAYTGLGSINTRVTTAAVNTESGTVELPQVPLSVAMNPSGTDALVATQGGVYAYVFNGEAVVALRRWDLGGVDSTGVTWVEGGSAFAVATTSGVMLYGLSASGLVHRVARVMVSGVVGVASGPSNLVGAIVAATRAGAVLYVGEDTSLVPITGGPSGLNNNLGVASTANGSIIATWQASAVQLWAWNGASYEPTLAWDPPAPPGRVVGVAFFPHGDGYWILTQQGQLLAYAFGLDGVTPLPAYSLARVADSSAPEALGSGWSGVSVAILTPSGWWFQDVGPGGVFQTDPPRSLTGQSWPVYPPSAVLQSVVLPVGHMVSDVRVEDANCPKGGGRIPCTDLASLPNGTSVSYEVSTDGCRTWTVAPLFTNVAVTPGTQLCYRLTLATTNPVETPVIHVTNLYEIATEVIDRSGAPTTLCLGSGCTSTAIALSRA